MKYMQAKMMRSGQEILDDTIAHDDGQFKARNFISLPQSNRKVGWVIIMETILKRCDPTFRVYC